ncbi:MAG: hypothetical protein A2Y25_02530 [Candidatus Melainabacteria bacterium GWF2_37_15]|nr:MAG: hypothetical protein A2Y25_02530 [Candidatus Melainabacteria bacterium GWF2_37_15]
MIQNLLSIAAGGAIGAILRFLMCEATFKITGIAYPLGTILVNLTGCFFIGLIWGVFSIFEAGNTTKLFIFTGLLGAFTTFSTFALENFYLIRNGEIQQFAFNVLISNIGGILLVFAGFYVAKILAYKY